MSGSGSTSGQGVTVQQSDSVVTIEGGEVQVVTPSPSLPRDTVTITHPETSCPVVIERTAATAVVVSSTSVVTVTVGANTQITITSPTNAVGTSGGSIVRVSSNDGSPGTLEDKIVAGTNVSLATLDEGGDEKLEISVSGGGGAGLGIWRYRTAITSNPAAGRLQFDNVAINSATELYVNQVNDGGTDLTIFLDLLVSGDLIYLQLQDDATQFALVEIGTPSKDSGVYTFPIVGIVSQGTTPTNNSTIAVVISIGAGAGVTDHGALSGLGDDDHAQYRDGTLAYTGDLDMGGNAVTSVGNVDGRDVSADGSTLDTHVADGSIHVPDANRAMEIENPTASEDPSFFRAFKELTVGLVNAVLIGSGGPSVTFTIRFDSDRAAVGTEILTAGRTVTSTTTGTDYAPDVAVIPAGSYVWVETSAQLGTVLEILITMEFSS